MTNFENRKSESYIGYYNNIIFIRFYAQLNVTLKNVFLLFSKKLVKIKIKKSMNKMYLAYFSCLVTNYGSNLIALN